MSNARTIEAIRAEETARRLAWEATEIAFSFNEVKQVDGIWGNHERKVTIAEARAEFDHCLATAGVKPEDWKSGFRVYKNKAGVLLAQRAIAFFHGKMPGATVVGSIASGSPLFVVDTCGYIG